MAVWQRYQHDDIQGLKVGRLNQGINTQFIVYRFGDTVIDSGPSNQWRHVKKFLNEQPVKQLLLTHHHEDHSGNAQSISKHFNLVPKAPELGREKLAQGFKIPLLQKVVWGRLPPVETVALSEEEFTGKGEKLVPVHTPGHAKDLTCFYVPSRGYVFSGDLYIAPRLKLLRSDENLEQLLSSIEKILALDFNILFCPHGGVIKQGKERLKAKFDSIMGLAQQAKDLQKQGKTELEIVQSLLGPEELTSRLTGGNFSKLNLIRECLKLSI